MVLLCASQFQVLELNDKLCLSIEKGKSQRVVRFHFLHLTFLFHFYPSFNELDLDISEQGSNLPAEYDTHV